MKRNPDEFLVWSHARANGLCRLTEFSGYDREHLLRRGVPLAGEWPADVRYGMDPFDRESMVLSDNVRCRRSVIVASQRLAEFLSARLGAAVECLPITVVDHKKRRRVEPYFIVNPLGLQDALDAEGSRPTWSTISTDVIDAVRRLVVDAARVAPEAQLFRLKHYLHPVLLRRSLAEAIDATGFSGTAWQELADHRSP